MKGKRIVILAGSSFPEPSETFIVRRIEALSDRFDQVVFGGHLKNQEQRDAFKNVKFLKLPRVFFPFVLRTFFQSIGSCCTSPRLAFRIFKISLNIGLGFKQSIISLLRFAPILIEKPDLIHFEFGNSALNFQYLVQIAKQLNIKTLVSFRGADIDFLPMRHSLDVYENVFQNIDHMHFVSEQLRKHAVDHLDGMKESKSTCIPSSIDVSFFQRKKAYEISSPVQLISIGRLHWKKGHEDVLRACYILKNKGVAFHLSIIGDGDHSEAIDQAIQDMDLSDTVTLCGSQNREFIQEKLDNSAIFLQASLEEGFGNSFLEAMAMQLPCVVTPAGGQPEAIVDGETGFVVPFQDAQKMAERIEWLLKHPEEAKLMGQRGRERVQAHYALSLQAESFAELYQFLLK